MAMLTITVQPDDGDEFEVPVGTRDVYHWEKVSRGKTFKGLMENMPMVDLYELAHLAARRQGMFTGTLADFVATCEIATVGEEQEDEDDDKAGPFPQARSDATSSPSPSSPASRRRSGQKKATGR
jgi:hypothetical protein